MTLVDLGRPGDPTRPRSTPCHSRFATKRTVITVCAVSSPRSDVRGGARTGAGSIRGPPPKASTGAVVDGRVRDRIPRTWPLLVEGTTSRRKRFCRQNDNMFTGSWSTGESTPRTHPPNVCAPTSPATRRHQGQLWQRARSGPCRKKAQRTDRSARDRRRRQPSWSQAAMKVRKSRWTTTPRSARVGAGGRSSV